MRLAKRRKRYRDERPTFLDYEPVSRYHNHGEQPMRPAGLTRQVSQPNRSEQAAKAHANLMSLLRSAELQGHNPVHDVLDVARRSIPAKAADIIREIPADPDSPVDLAA